jgi:hypothetical protein
MEEALSLTEVLENRKRAQLAMIEDHAQALRRCCLELVELIDSGEYVREAADCMYDKCKSNDAFGRIFSERQRRTGLINGMEIATGRVRRL